MKRKPPSLNVISLIKHGGYLIKLKQTKLWTTELCCLTIISSTASFSTWKFTGLKTVFGTKCLPLILAMLNKLMPRPLVIFSQSDYFINVVDTNSNTEWQTVQIQISCFFRSQLIWIYTVCKGRAYPGSAGQGLHVRVDPFSVGTWGTGKQTGSPKSCLPYTTWRKIYQMYLLTLRKRSFEQLGSAVWVHIFVLHFMCTFLYFNFVPPEN